LCLVTFRNAEAVHAFASNKGDKFSIIEGVDVKIKRSNERRILAVGQSRIFLFKATKKGLQVI
jgi:hypothetical protein